MWGRFLAQVGIISLKFLLETRLESKFFEHLISFLAFLIQQLWPKNNKPINYLIMGLINLLFLDQLFNQGT